MASELLVRLRDEVAQLVRDKLSFNGLDRMKLDEVSSLILALRAAEFAAEQRVDASYEQFTELHARSQQLHAQHAALHYEMRFLDSSLAALRSST
jgi:hypothetical protein